jgi:hypothetical protein
MILWNYTCKYVGVPWGSNNPFLGSAARAEGCTESHEAESRSPLAALFATRLGAPRRSWICHGSWRGVNPLEESGIFPSTSVNHWIGLRENLQETMVFTIKYGGFL